MVLALPAGRRRPDRAGRGAGVILRRIILTLLTLALLDVAAAGALSLGLLHSAKSARLLVSAHRYAALGPLLTRIAWESHGLQLTLYPAWILTPMPGPGPRVASVLNLVNAVRAGAAGAVELWPAVAPFAGGLGHAHGGTSGHALLARIAPDVHPALSRLHAALPAFHILVRDWSRVNFALLPGALRTRLPDPTRTTARLRGALTDLTEIDQASSAIPALLGLAHPARYLLLLQNSGELRATGGFLTAYGYLRMAHAVVGHLTAQNIYTLDPEHGPDRSHYQPPEPIELRLYLPWPVWHLRDSNVSPDVPTFARTFYRFYYGIPGTPRVDGLVLLDTWFVDRLLQAVGPTTVTVNGETVTLTAANANVTMEYLAEKSGLPQSTRKAFLSLAMKTLWHRALQARGAELRRVLQSCLYGLDREHVLLYLNNPPAERALVAAGWAGAMKRHVAGDYLQVVDENLNGHKDNFAFVESVATTLAWRHGRLVETTRVTWVDPAVGNGWMYVDYRAWVRLFVPPGATLLSLRGDRGLHFVSRDASLQKTVLNAHVFVLVRKSLADPPTRHTLTLVYAFPRGFRPATLTLQKQPGARSPRVRVTAGSFTRTVLLTRTLTLKLPPGY
ncbi:MAG: DUF4012 domain-containing protein [Clostridia bacterium]